MQIIQYNQQFVSLMGCVISRPEQQSTVQWEAKRHQNRVPTIRVTDASLRINTQQNQHNLNTIRQIHIDSAQQRPMQVPQEVITKKEPTQKKLKKRHLITSMRQDLQRVFQAQSMQGSQEQQPTNAVIQQMLSDEDLEGAIREENNFSTIMIYNSRIYMEFSLPKHKAGPLIVPLINYQTYRL